MNRQKNGTRKTARCTSPAKKTAKPHAEASRSPIATMSTYVVPDPRALRKPTAQASNAFHPYLKKALNRDLRKLFEFWKLEGWAEGTPEPAFCECVGFLALSPLPEHRKLADRIIQLEIGTLAKDRFSGTGAKLETARFVVRQLNQFAQDAVTWLRNYRKSKPLKPSQQTLWAEYLKARGVTEQAADAVAPCAVPVSPAKAHRIMEGHLTLGSWNADGHFRFRGIVPKGLFIAIAGAPRGTRPSHTLRKYAAKLVGIAESVLARKHPRKL